MKVLRLPMRDGNFVFLPLSFRSALVLRLPMRDGNSSLRDAAKPGSEVLRLPMRDGNSQVHLLSGARAGRS